VAGAWFSYDDVVWRGSESGVEMEGVVRGCLVWFCFVVEIKFDDVICDTEAVTCFDLGFVDSFFI